MSGNPRDGAPGSVSPAPGSNGPATGRFAGLLGKVRDRLREGPYAIQVSLGLRRDLAVPMAPPPARIPLGLRDFRRDDLATLFPAGCAPSGWRERADVLWRLRMVERGAFASRCFVAVDERSGSPCHIQWLTERGYSDEIRRAGALPTLAVDEALLENAYTPPGHRGLGVMAAAVSLIADRAAAAGTRHLVAFVDVGNLPSLAAARRAGMSPWSVRTRRKYGFGLVRRVRFEPVSATDFPPTGPPMDEPVPGTLA